MSRPPVPAALREASLAALVAALLALPFGGLHLMSQGGAQTLETRWPEFALAVAFVFLGRLGISLSRAGHVSIPLAGGLALAAAGALSLMAADGAALAGLPALPGTFLPVVACAGGAAVAGMALRRHAAPLAAAAARSLRPSRSGLADRLRRLALRNVPALRSSRSSAASKLLLCAGAGLAVFAVLLPVLPFADRRLIDVGTLVLTYVMLGWGLNIVVGLAGLLDLGYVAFYAVGAYSYALISTQLGGSFWVSLPLAGGFAALFGILLGFPVLRLRGDYLAIVTLGFGEMIRIILLNWYDFTNGPDGIAGIGRPSFFGLPFTPAPGEGAAAFHTFFGIEFSPIHRLVFLYYLILVLALFTNAFTLRIRRLPVGRAWEALREDEIACRSLGINPTNTKLSAFAIGAMFGGFAGAFFATRQGFVSPESFTFIESAIILAIVVLGGMGSQIGVAVAAVILVGLPEYFRDLQDYRMLAFGAGMVLIMIWRPSGLLTHREPTIRAGPAAGPAP